MRPSCQGAKSKAQQQASNTLASLWGPGVLSLAGNTHDTVRIQRVYFPIITTVVAGQPTAHLNPYNKITPTTRDGDPKGWSTISDRADGGTINHPQRS